jgi:hypothetical protein
MTNNSTHRQWHSGEGGMLALLAHTMAESSGGR